MAKVNVVAPMGEFHEVAQLGIVVEVVVWLPDWPHIHTMVSLQTAFTEAGEKDDAFTVMGMIAAFAKEAERANVKIA